MTKIHVEFARWDLRNVDMTDPKSGGRLCPIYPLDRRKNADGRRRKMAQEPGAKSSAPAPKSGMAPLLKQLMAEYAASGLPPAYIPMCSENEQERTEDDDQPVQEDNNDNETT